MNNIDGLHHIGIPTADIDATIGFYSNFGAEIIFEKVDSFEENPIRVVLMAFANVVLELYERSQTALIAGAMDHLAFKVQDIDGLYRIAKEKGLKLMQDCSEEIQVSTYWPDSTRWFIIYGINNEKIEFCESMK